MEGGGGARGEEVVTMEVAMETVGGGGGGEGGTGDMAEDIEQL